MATRTAASTLLALLVGAGFLVAAPSDLAEAIEAQRTLAAESPTPAVLNDLANLLVLAGQQSEAESTYRQVLAGDPKNEEAQFNLGLLVQSRGRRDEARDLYLSVLDKDPQNAWAHYQMGTIHEFDDERQEAIQSYARALALDPELFFADVNPQVVSNGMLTEALLEAARLRETRSLAPMKYARPREMTQLLLSLPGIAIDDPN